MKEKSVSKQSEGGKARAEKLTLEERKAIAQAGAAARWQNATDLPKASHDGDLHINEAVIKAAVLPNGKRLISQASFLRALDRSPNPPSGSGGLSNLDGLPFFLQAEQLKPFISEELRSSTTPIVFRLKSGQRTVGYDANLLPMVCEVYLKLRDFAKGAELKRYSDIIKACDILMRGLARVGIVALVDEATGYQEVRDRLALQVVLRKYISGALYEWAQTFPIEFYKNVFRLKGWKWNEGKMPPVVGKYVNDIVYDRLTPGVLQELQRLNPKDEHGRRKSYNYQFFTPGFGHPALIERLRELVGMAKACDDGGWDRFKRIVDRNFPKMNQTIPLPLPES